ncbi:MAG: GNAT family N-acetyltransferase, partial [Alphaproteobacteria bacterium]|nr:GNAT family N-acetyltransferase [Alphaproteobacteria bacterium]
PWWGQGFATEAAYRVARFAFEDLDLAALLASHRVDNAESGRVLAKCGFQYTGDGMQWSEALGKELPVCRLTLTRERFEAISRSR